MRVDLFDFDLPPERIALAPASPRDSARLLHVDTQLCDLHARDLPALLSPGDVLVMNDSRVIPARLFTTIGDRQVEVLLHQPVSVLARSDSDAAPERSERGESLESSFFSQPIQRMEQAALPSGLPRYARNDVSLWTAFAKPARKLKDGMVLTFADGFEAQVTGRTPDGQVLLRFPYDPATLFAKLRAHGHMPLPPYIQRADAAVDQQDYQTVYAAHDGSVAAPTAGLHFTPQLLAALKGRGVETVFVTLHVGAGTFQPVKVEDTADHIMHREQIELSAEAAATINAARARGGKVVAVGTTSLRILESVAAEDGTLAPFTGETGIFITPGYRFKVVDRLMTNFHLPKSTLFMLVSAFAGVARMRAAYDHAIATGYRFYSYGDTSLLERAS